MVTQKQIDDFLLLKTLAVIGVSRNEKKFGNAIYKELKSKKYTLYPVHSEMDNFNGDVCYQNLKSLPTVPDGLVVAVNKEKSLGIVKEALLSGIKKIWLQQMSDSAEAIDYCEKNGIDAIYKQCMFMYLQPVTSIHGFHRFFKKLFGGMPK